MIFQKNANGALETMRKYRDINYATPPPTFAELSVGAEGRLHSHESLRMQRSWSD
jgi:hypothetical protein